MTDGTDWPGIIREASIGIALLGAFAVTTYLQLRPIKKAQEATAAKIEENAKTMDGKLSELMKANVAVAKHEGAEEAAAKQAALQAAENVGRLKALAEQATSAPGGSSAATTTEIADKVIAGVDPATEPTLQKVLDKLPEPKLKE